VVEAAADVVTEEDSARLRQYEREEREIQRSQRPRFVQSYLEYQYSLEKHVQHYCATIINNVDNI
jgi:hypothetical protein